MNIEEAIKNLKIYMKITNFQIENGEIFLDSLVDAEKIQIKSIQTLLTAYEKEKKKNNKIDEFCRKELAFERRLKRENREPDEFNQGRFYVSENIRKIIEEE